MIESRAIVRAKVKSVSTGLNEQSGIVYTYIKLKVTDVIKGDIRDSVIVLKQPGGATADHGTMIFSAPRFTVGEQVIVYLQTMNDGTLQVHDAFLGKYSIVKDAASGTQMVVRGAPLDDVHILPGTSQGDSTQKMELGAYLTKLRAGLSANMPKSQDFADQFYARTPMLSRPPEYEEKLRSGGLTPQFHVFPAPYTSRWFEPDSGQPVNFLIDSDQAPSGVSDDINAAMAAWSTVPGCSMRMVNGGSTTNCIVAGADVADFDNCVGLFSAAGGSCQSILAEGGFDYNPGQTVVVNGTSFMRIVEGYLSLNPYAACYFGDHCSLREVVTHEMGHTIGMGHSWDPTYGGSPTAVEQDATMFYIAHFDGRCASIHSDDMAGITFIYPGTSGGSSNGSTVGLYSGSSGQFSLRYSNTAGGADLTFAYGPPAAGWIALSGDWNGDGIVTPGLYDPSTSTWFLKNSNTTGVADVTFAFGPPNSGWMPIVGDWDGNGTDTVGFYDPVRSLFFLKNANSTGVADVTFAYGPGNLGWLPIVGHWNGAGADTVGLFDPSRSIFFLKNANSTGVADTTFAYGPPNLGWKPIVGSWNGTGASTVGLYNPSSSMWFLKNSNTTGVADTTFAFGSSSAPLTGKWH
jgi:hypothetical protein